MLTRELRSLGTERCLQVLYFSLSFTSSSFRVVFSRSACQQHRYDIDYWQPVFSPRVTRMSIRERERKGALWTIGVGARVLRPFLLLIPSSLKRFASYSLPDCKKTDCQQSIMTKPVRNGTGVHG